MEKVKSHIPKPGPIFLSKKISGIDLLSTEAHPVHKKAGVKMRVMPAVADKFIKNGWAK